MSQVFTIEFSSKDIGDKITKLQNILSDFQTKLDKFIKDGGDIKLIDSTKTTGSPSDKKSQPTSAAKTNNPQTSRQKSKDAKSNFNKIRKEYVAKEKKLTEETAVVNKKIEVLKLKIKEKEKEIEDLQRANLPFANKTAEQIAKEMRMEEPAKASKSRNLRLLKTKTRELEKLKSDLSILGARYAGLNNQLSQSKKSFKNEKILIDRGSKPLSSIAGAVGSLEGKTYFSRMSKKLDSFLGTLKEVCTFNLEDFSSGASPEQLFKIIIGKAPPGILGFDFREHVAPNQKKERLSLKQLIKKGKVIKYPDGRYFYNQEFQFYKAEHALDSSQNYHPEDNPFRSLCPSPISYIENINRILEDYKQYKQLPDAWVDFLEKYDILKFDITYPNGKKGKNKKSSTSNLKKLRDNLNKKSMDSIKETQYKTELLNLDILLELVDEVEDAFIEVGEDLNDLATDLIDKIKTVEDAYKFFLNKYDLGSLVATAIECANKKIPWEEIEKVICEQAVGSFVKGIGLDKLQQDLGTAATDVQGFINTFSKLEASNTQLGKSTKKTARETKAALEFIKKSVDLTELCRAMIDQLPAFGKLMSQGNLSQFLKRKKQEFINSLPKIPTIKLPDRLFTVDYMGDVTQLTKKNVLNSLGQFALVAVKTALIQIIRSECLTDFDYGGQNINTIIASEGAAEILNRFGTGATQPEISDLFDDISLLLTPSEICRLLSGASAEPALQIVKEVVRLKHPQFQDIFQDLDQITEVFLLLASVSDTSICEDILSRDFAPYDECFDNKEEEELRQCFLSRSNIDSKVLDSLFEGAKKRRLDRLRDLIKLLESDNPAEEVVDSIFCEEGTGGLISTAFTTTMSDSVDLVVDTVFDGVESAYEAAVAQFAPTLVDSIVETQTEEIPWPLSKMRDSIENDNNKDNEGAANKGKGLLPKEITDKIAGALDFSNPNFQSQTTKLRNVKKLVQTVQPALRKNYRNGLFLGTSPDALRPDYSFNFPQREVFAKDDFLAGRKFTSIYNGIFPTKTNETFIYRHRTGPSPIAPLSITQIKTFDYSISEYRDMHLNTAGAGDECRIYEIVLPFSWGMCHKASLHPAWDHGYLQDYIHYGKAWVHPSLHPISWDDWISKFYPELTKGSHVIPPIKWRHKGHSLHGDMYYMNDEEYDQVKDSLETYWIKYIWPNLLANYTYRVYPKTNEAYLIGVSIKDYVDHMRGVFRGQAPKINITDCFYGTEKKCKYSYSKDAVMKVKPPYNIKNYRSTYTSLEKELNGGRTFQWDYSNVQLPAISGLNINLDFFAHLHPVQFRSERETQFDITGRLWSPEVEGSMYTIFKDTAQQQIDDHFKKDGKIIGVPANISAQLAQREKIEHSPHFPSWLGQPWGTIPNNLERASKGVSERSRIKNVLDLKGSAEATLTANFGGLTGQTKSYVNIKKLKRYSQELVIDKPVEDFIKINDLDKGADKNKENPASTIFVNFLNKKISKELGTGIERFTQTLNAQNLYTTTDSKIFKRIAQHVSRSSLFARKSIIADDTKAAYGLAGVNLLELINWSPPPTPLQKSCGISAGMFRINEVKRKAREDYKNAMKCMLSDSDEDFDVLLSISVVRLTISLYVVEAVMASIFSFSMFDVDLTTLEEFLVEIIIEDMQESVRNESQRQDSSNVLEYYNNFFDLVGKVYIEDVLGDPKVESVNCVGALRHLLKREIVTVVKRLKNLIYGQQAIKSTKYDVHNVFLDDILPTYEPIKTEAEYKSGKRILGRILAKEEKIHPNKTNQNTQKPENRNFYAGGWFLEKYIRVSDRSALPNSKVNLFKNRSFVYKNVTNIDAISSYIGKKIMPLVIKSKKDYGKKEKLSQYFDDIKFGLRLIYVPPALVGSEDDHSTNHYKHFKPQLQREKQTFQDYVNKFDQSKKESLSKLEKSYVENFGSRLDPVYKKVVYGRLPVVRQPFATFFGGRRRRQGRFPSHGFSPAEVKHILSPGSVFEMTTYHKLKDRSDQPSKIEITLGSNKKEDQYPFRKFAAKMSATQLKQLKTASVPKKYDLNGLISIFQLGGVVGYTGIPTTHAELLKAVHACNQIFSTIYAFEYYTASSPTFGSADPFGDLQASAPSLFKKLFFINKKNETKVHSLKRFLEGDQKQEEVNEVSLGFGALIPMIEIEESIKDELFELFITEEDKAPTTNLNKNLLPNACPPEEKGEKQTENSTNKGQFSAFNFRPQYEECYFPKLKEKMMNSLDYNLLFKYLFPLPTHMNALAVHNVLYNRATTNITDLFNSVKNNIFNISQILENVGELDYEDRRLKEAGGNVGILRGNVQNPKIDPNDYLGDRLFPIAAMAAMTPVLMLKGLIESYDPNVAPAAFIARSVNSTKKDIINQAEPFIAMAEMAEGAGRGLSDPLNKSQQDALDAARWLIDLAKEVKKIPDMPVWIPSAAIMFGALGVPILPTPLGWAYLTISTFLGDDILERILANAKLRDKIELETGFNLGAASEFSKALQLQVCADEYSFGQEPAKGGIVMSDYSTGAEFVVEKTGEEYVGYYHLHSNGVYMEGKEHLGELKDENAQRILIPLK